MKTLKKSQLLLLAFFGCLFLGPIILNGQGIIDQPTGDHTWASFRNLSQSDYQAKLNQYKSQGMRPVDIEITGGSKRTYSIVFRQNKDRRNWELRTGLSSQDYNKKWTEMKNKGFRPVDQETHLLNGKRYFGALWIHNKEKYEWVSFRNLTSQQFSQRFTEYKRKGYLPVDLDIYPSGNELRYSVIWVQNKQKTLWKEYRNLTTSTFKTKFDEMSKSGYRLMDVEAYQRNRRQEYATIWVKDNRRWAAHKNLTSKQFKDYWTQYKDEGYRLEDVEAFQTSSGTRYAGCWVQNKSRLLWRHKKAIDEDLVKYRQGNWSAGMSVAIAERGQIRYLRGFGTQGSKGAHGNTIYRVASISKAITSILAFQLQENNLLRINNSTRSYERLIPAHHTHTVGQLLSNRGKVRGYKKNDPVYNVRPNYNYPNALSASRLFSGDPLIQESYKYSTHGYTLAAIALEKVGREDFPDLLNLRISRRFNVPSLQCEDLKKNVPERSAIYGKKANAPGFEELTPESLSWKYAGGGMEASAYDLTQLGIQLLDHKIISEESLNTMTTVPVSDGENYAYGWNTGTYKNQKYFAKSGGQPGSKAYMICFPDKDIVVTILCNTNVKSLAAKAKELAGKMW